MIASGENSTYRTWKSDVDSVTTSKGSGRYASRSTPNIADGGYSADSVFYLSPFSVLDPKRVADWLSEGGFSPRFSARQRAYYRLVRPWLPIPVRQWIQRRHWRRVAYDPHFIDSEMVDWVYASELGRQIASGLYPEGYQFAIVLTHDVETEAGLRRAPKIIELEERYGFRSSWNIVPFKYPVDPGILREIRSAGHEIGVHGYNHDGRLFWSRMEFERRAQKINEIVREWQVVGFRAPMVHRNLAWMQKLEVLYDASCFDYDMFQPFPGGVKSIWPFMAGRIVELPYTLPQDHTVFVVLQQKDATLWRSKAKWLIQHHGVVLLITHPDYLDSAARVAVYEEFLDFLGSTEGGWKALPRELAAFWRRAWSESSAQRLSEVDNSAGNDKFRRKPRAP